VSAVVSDSSPLNYLALLSDFDLLRQIYHTVVIPPAVYREVVESGADYPVAKAVEAALGDWASVAEAPRRWLPFAVPSISTSVKARRFWSRKRSGMLLF
jgi:predicted nucleic acid-binding protein